MRLFVGLPLPEDVRGSLAALAGGLPGAKWVAPENLHVTLRFLGELDNSQAADVDAALASIKASGFAIDLAGVGKYGNGNKIRVLWAGVTANPALLRLHDKVEQAVVGAGLAPEPRKFKAHVTLARFKSSPGPKLPDYLAHHALFRAGPVSIEGFTLFSSFLSAGGAIHRPEAEYPLAPWDATSL